MRKARERVGMGKKSIGERTCMGCGRKAHKAELLRFVVDETGGLLFDLGQRAAGRGGYLCRRASCLDQAVKRRRISVRFRRDVRVDLNSVMRAVEQQIGKGERDLTEDGQGPWEGKKTAQRALRARASKPSDRKRNSPQVSLRRG